MARVDPSPFRQVPLVQQPWDLLSLRRDTQKEALQVTFDSPLEKGTRMKEATSRSKAVTRQVKMETVVQLHYPPVLL